MRFSGFIPEKSFQQLEQFVQSIGLEPKQVIGFTETKWITPGDKKNPGRNRSGLAGTLFLNIIKHKQRACCTCGKSFEDITADELSGIHLDHREGSIKGSLGQPSGYKKYEPAVAVAEWKKCESKCAWCHNQAMGPGNGDGKVKDRTTR